MAIDGSFRGILQEILELQPSWAKENTPEMERRGRLIRTEGPRVLRDWDVGQGTAIRDLTVEGSDGVGLKARVPWIRLFSKARSPAATSGWYLVYLFATDGSAVYLSLNQGTTDPRVGGGFGRRSTEFLAERVEWARGALAGNVPPSTSEKISLNDPGLGAGYEHGNVIASSYARDAIPEDQQLRNDLEAMLNSLALIYQAETEFEGAPRGFGPGEALSGFTKPAPLSEETIQLAPNDPGVHVIWDPTGELLYVGSTTRQRDRLRQHLQGDRQASILHSKIGRQLDAELEDEATRDQIRSYLHRCTVSWISTPQTDALKARIMDELHPQLNDVRPSAPDEPLALVSYVGRRASTNLRVGIDARTWGFSHKREDYSQIREGDWILLGSGFTGGSPRTSSTEWVSHRLEEIFIGRISRTYFEDPTPLWPNEKIGEVSYPHRFQFEIVERLSDVDLASEFIGPDVAEALRLSATNRGLGYVVPATGTAFGAEAPPPEVLADLSLICKEFASALVEANLDFGDGHVDLARTFVVSLATKGLALLTGLSGSGKTRIGLSFGQWLGKGRLLLLPVRPDWTGPEALLGYEDALLPASEDGRRSWHVPEALQFILNAASHPDEPFLLLLDEMNLAHVERYFADVLSGIESDEPVIPDLFQEDGFWRLRPDADKIRVPNNLFVVGTVNVDETTYMFSPKVLDRSNTIEFGVRSEDLRSDSLKPTALRPGEEKLARGFLFIAQDDSFRANNPADNQDEIADRLRGLHRLLKPHGFEFGHRTFYEALRFAALLQAAGEGSPWRALDLQVKQKVLPRIHGSTRRVREPLALIAQFCFDPGVAISTPNVAFEPEDAEVTAIALPESFDKVHRMIRSLRANQYVSFSE